MKVVSTAKELGEAIKQKEDTIEIVGNLATSTIRIRATGKIAWGIAIAAIAIAIYGMIAAQPVSGFVAAPAAVGVLGVSATGTAMGIAVAAGGVGSLTSLREYKEISRSKDKLVLQRK